MKIFGFGISENLFAAINELNCIQVMVFQFQFVIGNIFANYP